MTSSTAAYVRIVWHPQPGLVTQGNTAYLFAA